MSFKFNSTRIAVTTLPQFTKALAIGSALIVVNGALAQEIEYDGRVLPQAPDDPIIDWTNGINNQGEVVGQASYPWNPYSLRAWH